MAWPTGWRRNCWASPLCRTCAGNRVELETCLAATPDGLAIQAADGQQELLRLPMDPAIALEAARIEAGMLVLEGTARVTP